MGILLPPSLPDLRMSSNLFMYTFTQKPTFKTKCVCYALIVIMHHGFTLS